MFKCEPNPDDEGSLQHSSNPFIKHCPVQGRNTTAASAIVFDKIHNSLQAEEVSFQLMCQLKLACKGDEKLEKIDDQWLDIRYNRSNGYTMNVLSDNFSALMLVLAKIKTNEIKVDDKYGSLSKVSPSAAKTHYLNMTKSGVGEEAKGVMFGLPPATTEEQIGEAVMELYTAVQSVPVEEREGLGLPNDFAPVKITDFEIQLRNGTFSNGDEYRMAFVTCPSVTIFELDEEWRTSSIVSDRGKPSVLMKKKPKDEDNSNDSGHEKASPSLRTESRFGADEDCGEGDVDYEVEEADLGRAGHAGTPQAYQKEVDTLKRSIDLLTKNKVASLSKEDIQGMIAVGHQSAVKDVDGKLAIMKNSTMETLKKINCAYGDLVKLESDRVRIFREAVTRHHPRQ